MERRLDPKTTGAYPTWPGASVSRPRAAYPRYAALGAGLQHGQFLHAAYLNNSRHGWLFRYRWPAAHPLLSASADSSPHKRKDFHAMEHRDVGARHWNRLWEHPEGARAGSAAGGVHGASPSSSRAPDEAGRGGLLKSGGQCLPVRHVPSREAWPQGRLRLQPAVPERAGLFEGLALRAGIPDARGQAVRSCTQQA